MKLREKRRWEIEVDSPRDYGAVITLTTEWEAGYWTVRFYRNGGQVYSLILTDDQGNALSDALTSLDWDASIEEEE